MKLTSESRGDILIISFAEEGSLEASNVIDFREAVMGLLKEGDKVVLDLGNVNFMDSSGLGAIVALRRRLSRSEGDLRLANITPQVRTVFELTRLHQAFEIYDTVEEAAASFVRMEKTLELRGRREGGILIITFAKEGVLEAGNVMDFREAVMGLLKEGDKVVLDLGNVNFMDSSGLGAIVALGKSLAEGGGELKLANITPQVRTVFELTRLHQAFEIYDTVEEAAASFREYAGQEIN